jgi:AcrR family transcriptional regulator
MTTSAKKRATIDRSDRVRPRPARREDPRAARTIDNILGAAVAILLDRGASKLSASDVCDKAGVSRATFYRYFASKEELLKAVSIHLRDQTDQDLAQGLAGSDDPHRRWEAFLDSPDTTTPQAASLLKMEPTFVLDYLKASFDYNKTRLTQALEPVFDAWEAELGGVLNRDLLAELIVRYAQSEMLTPSGRSRRALAEGVAEIVALLRRRPR